MRSSASRVAVAFGVACVVALAALGALFVPASAKTSYPNFTAPVVDAADVVPDDAEQRISADLLDYQRRSGNQIAVAVVKTTGDESLEDYSIDLARRWGVGAKASAGGQGDNGVLVLIAYDDRKLRIEVGRGLEGDLTDLESGRIIREQMVARIREGDVGGAIEAATQSIRVALGDTSATAPAPVVGAPADEDEGFPVAALPVLIFIGISVLSSFGRRRRRFGWMTPLVYGTVFGGAGSGSGFGGSSSGGGFSGGGGGSFGGGGASGSW